MKTLITWFLNQVMLARPSAGGAASEEPCGKRIETATRTVLKTRYGRRSSETAVPGSVRDTGLWTVCRVGEALVNAIVESYLRGVSTRRVRRSSVIWIDHSPGFGFPDGRTSTSGAGIPPAADQQAISYLFVDASYYKIGTEHGKSPRVWWSPGCEKMVTGDLGARIRL